MDEKDTAWLSLVALLDQFDTSDELVDALFAEKTPSILAGGSPSATTTPDSSLDSDGPPAPSRTPVKRKRVRTSRPNHEIQRLRQSVQDLETLIALHRQRQVVARALVGNDAGSTQAASAPVGIWESVAARQFKYLREVQAENQRLRDQVQRQVGIIKSMIRLVQRAQMGLPSSVIPRSRAGLDTDMITERRTSLFSLTSEMYSELDSVFEKSPFTTAEPEFREVTINKYDGEDIPPGSILATTCVGRLVLQPVLGLADLLWNVNQSEQAAREAFKVEHRDETESSQSFVYSVHIATPYGSTLCQGVGIRARFREEDRDVVITTGSMWPYPNSPFPLNALAYDFREWTVVQPHEHDHVQKRVLVKFETSRPSHRGAPASLTSEQASVLQFFIVQAHHFIVEQEQRRIDAILLGQVGSRNDDSGDHIDCQSQNIG